MRVIADLHIHSRFARACSKGLTVENLAKWGDRKGIQVLATGDFTHPGWFAELGDELIEVKPGLYEHKSKKYKTLFLYGTELSSIYKQSDSGGIGAGKVRRVHNLIFAPNRESALKINQALEACGCNLKSDGRPITGVKCPDLVSIVKEMSGACEVVPAHAWTPHFGVFGSLSGFDSLEEAFGEYNKYIFAIETGLSSDPAMNRRISALDHLSLISNSDTHSLHRLGRETNVFEIKEDKLSYSEIFRIIKDKHPKEFLETIEFFPEEGRYHLDGHRECKFSCEPKKTKSLGGKCPVCGKLLLRGVLSRIEDLADRPTPGAFNGTMSFHSAVPLDELIGITFGVGVASKKVQAMYERMLSFKPELEILMTISPAEIEKISTREIAAAVLAVRDVEIDVVPGYDGVYGKVLLNNQLNVAGQKQLFEFMQ